MTSEADPRDFDLWTVEGARGFAAAIRQELTQHIDSGGVVSLTVLLVVPRKGEPQPTVADCSISTVREQHPGLDWREQRDLFREAVRGVAKSTGAIAAISLTEAYVATSPDGKRDSLPEDLSEYDGSVEMLYVSLEHRELERNDAWQAAVSTDGDKRTVGAWEEMQHKELKGRFAKFLP